MGDPISGASKTLSPTYNQFEIVSTTDECLQRPTDPSKDPCKVKVTEVEKDLSFQLERKLNVFQVASGDLPAVLKAYPNYRAPLAELTEYFAVKAEFSKVFGDEQNPSDIFKKVTIPIGSSSADKNKVVFNWLNVAQNFITHGQLAPKHAKMKTLQESTIQVSAYTFADPVLGVLVEKILKGLKDNSKLSPESRKRTEWLLGIYAARETFWSTMKPAMEKSTAVSDQLKLRSVELMIFLFANHVLAEKGYDALLYSDQVKSSAKLFHDVFTKVDPTYNAGKNYYAFMKASASSLRKAAIPEEYKGEFLQRIAFLENEYEKASQKEMNDLLSAQLPEPAFREYLEIKYGDTPLRAEALEIILKNMTMSSGDGQQKKFLFSMETIASELKKWAAGKATEQRTEALEAILYLLKALFEKGGRLQVFWDKKVQEIDNFYTTGNFSIISFNKKALEDLIVWARNSAAEQKLVLPPENLPHVGLRKWTFGSELGIGVAGLGVGTALAFAPIKDKNSQYFTQGSSIILGSSALGAAGGNLLSYKLNVTKNAWLFDVGGAVVGGLIGGLIYGLATPPPPALGGPNGSNPGQRFPVDGYGP